MLVLAGANVVGVVLFVTLYAAAAAHYVPQPAFLVCLPLLFLLVTVLWVRTEARHRALDPLRRIGRIAGGLAIVAIVTPVVVLLPLFWLETVAPADAGVTRVLAPAMTLLLIALALTVLVNAVGGVIVAGRGAVAAMQRPRTLA
jgi:hypothetical protein